MRYDDHRGSLVIHALKQAHHFITLHRIKVAVGSSARMSTGSATIARAAPPAAVAPRKLHGEILTAVGELHLLHHIFRRACDPLHSSPGTIMAIQCFHRHSIIDQIEILKDEPDVFLRSCARFFSRTG
jgi:hypothetical protein